MVLQCTNYSDAGQMRGGCGAGAGRRQIKLQNVSNQIILYVKLSDEGSVRRGRDL